MTITNLNRFLHHFFTSHHCPIIENRNGILKVQLTEEMDMALMNRPFYWHYVNKMGQKGNPMQLTLITNPDKREEKGEWIHYGSPRLHQLLNHLKDNERFTKLYQKMEVTKNIPLYPWLVLNIKISYQGKQKKDEILSIGLQLVNGNMRMEMMDYLKRIPLQMTISDYCYTISPIIMLRSGFLRIEKVILNYLEAQDYTWAQESLQTLEDERKILKYFFEGNNDEQEMEKEEEEIIKRYQPIISYKIINGGIFYLNN